MSEAKKQRYERCLGCGKDIPRFLVRCQRCYRRFFLEEENKTPENTVENDDTGEWTQAEFF